MTPFIPAPHPWRLGSSFLGAPFLLPVAGPGTRGFPLGSTTWPPFSPSAGAWDKLRAPLLLLVHGASHSAGAPLVHSAREKSPMAGARPCCVSPCELELLPPGTPHNSSKSPTPRTERPCLPSDLWALAQAPFFSPPSPSASSRRPPPLLFLQSKFSRRLLSALPFSQEPSSILSWPPGMASSLVLPTMAA